MPFISVIIPTHNRASWLPQSIDSVLAQTYTDYELIVVDDGSTDNTQAVLQSYGPQLQMLRTPKNRGVSHARNLGIQHTNSPWIAFLDSDDQWHPQKLEKQVTQIHQYSEYLVHFTDELWIRNGKRVNPKKRHQKQEGWVFQLSLSLCLMAPSTILIHRQIFDTVGWFDESLEVCEDYDLWLRIAAKHPVKLLDEALMTRHGGHEDQLSSKYWGNDRFRVQSLHHILQTVTLKPEDAIAAKKKLQEKCQILIQGFQRRGKHQELQYYQKLWNHYEEDG